MGLEFLSNPFLFWRNIMSKILFRRSSIFCDLENVLVYTDGLVIDRLMNHMDELSIKESDYAIPLTEFFIEEKQKFEQMGGYHYILQNIMAGKKSKNPLIDIFDWDKYESGNILEWLDEIYVKLLASPELGKLPLILSNLGESIRQLLKDDNLEKVCIYLDHDYPYIREEVQELFSNDNKIELVSGEKEEFLKTHDFDSHFFQDIEDLQYITKKYPNRIEVCVPNYAFNFTEKLIYEDSDDTYRTLITDEPVQDYLEKYNMEIVTISTPI